MSEQEKYDLIVKVSDLLYRVFEGKKKTHSEILEKAVLLILNDILRQHPAACMFNGDTVHKSTVFHIQFAAAALFFLCQFTTCQHIFASIL